MPVTLNQVAKQMKDPLVKGVIMSLLRYSDVLGLLPFETVGSLKVESLLWRVLPTVGFRKINDGYSESSGDTEPREWSLKGLGGDVDIDKVFDKITNYIEHPRVTQTKMKIKAAAYTFNHYLINGSPALDADGFYGLAWIVDQLDSRQKLCVGTQGTPFDATASTTNQHKFLDALHELSDLVGGADAFFCNRKMRLGVAAVLRRSGLLTTTKDQFDRTIFEFDGAPIIDIGLQRDQSTEIITDTEDPGDGGSDTTSIYAAKFGTDEGLIGIQLNDLDAYWVGGEGHELEAKPASRLRIDWWTGLAGFGKWFTARAYNLEPAGSWT